MILLSWKILKVNDHRPDELSYSAKACLIRSWWSSDWRKLWGQPNLISGLHTRKEIQRLSQICKTNPRLLPGGGGRVFLSSKTFQWHHSVLIVKISTVWHFEAAILKCNKTKTESTFYILEYIHISVFCWLQHIVVYYDKIKSHVLVFSRIILWYISKYFCVFQWLPHPGLRWNDALDEPGGLSTAACCRGNKLLLSRSLQQEFNKVLISRYSQI